MERASRKDVRRCELVAEVGGGCVVQQNFGGILLSLLVGRRQVDPCWGGYSGQFAEIMALLIRLG